MAHDDGEGVENQEGTDKERNCREAQKHFAEDVNDFVDRASSLLCRLLTGDDLVVRWQNFFSRFLHIATRRICVEWKLPFTTSYHTKFPEYVSARFPIPVQVGYAYMKWFHKPSGRLMVATPTLRDELLERGFRNVSPWSRGVDTELFRPDLEPIYDSLGGKDWPRPFFLNVGRVAVEGDAFVARDLRQARRDMQIIFQDTHASLDPRMTVGEIVSEGLRLHHGQASASQIEAQVVATLAEVGLSIAAFPDLLSRYPHSFSGGQRQRIALARALVVGPDLLVLDEPTSALDVTVQKQILKLLQELQSKRGMAYLLITHDIDVLRAMAHQVMVLQGGRIAEAGSAEQVLYEPRHAYTRSLLAAFPNE